PSAALLPLHSFPTRRSSDLTLYQAAVLQAAEQAAHRGSRDACGPCDDGGVRRGLQLVEDDELLKAESEARSAALAVADESPPSTDRKSTRLNSSHVKISYAV